MRNLVAKFQPLLLIVISIAFAVGLVELTYRAMYGERVNTNSGKSNRYMLLGLQLAAAYFKIWTPYLHINPIQLFQPKRFMMLIIIYRKNITINLKPII